MTHRTSEERTAWVALAAAPGVGPVTFQRFLVLHGSARAALDAVGAMSHRSADRTLASELGMRPRPGLAASLRRAAADPESPLRRVADLGGWVLTPLDAAFPPKLQALEEPPLVIYGLGSPLSLQASRSVAVVGTRRATGSGRMLASRIGARLAQAGAIVVSGLAVGIDAAAHAGTLDAGGQTIAVVGSGLDDPGPRAHRRLMSAIAAHGAVITELAPGVAPSRGTFPRRNRIISALAAGTIVVEAPARSGALITARHALEQGRPLLVAPGRPLDPAVAGCLALLRETPARPLVGLDEMLVDLALEDPAPSSGPSARLSAMAALGMLAPSQRAVAEALLDGPQTVDAIVRRSGQATGVVAAALTLLQLRGWASALGPMQLAAGPLLTQPEAGSTGSAPSETRPPGSSRSRSRSSGSWSMGRRPGTGPSG
jgi:DNA processing protein